MVVSSDKFTDDFIRFFNRCSYRLLTSAYGCGQSVDWRDQVLRISRHRPDRSWCPYLLRFVTLAGNRAGCDLCDLSQFFLPEIEPSEHRLIGGRSGWLAGG